MKLLSLNVSMNKVNSVIKIVLEGLAKKKVDRLPSAGVQTRILQESLLLAHMQVADALLEVLQNIISTTRISKSQSKVARPLSFGLAEISGGDAASSSKCFTEAVDDLRDAITDAITGDKDNKYSQLVSSIKTTMSDLGPVNPVFN